MSSDLENFIQQNKERFDSETPADKVWDNIEKNIPAKGKVFTIREVYRWSAAAAVFCILLTSTYFLFLRNPAAEVPVVKTELPEKSLHNEIHEILNFAPEYADEAKQIFEAIEVSQLELQRKAKDEPQLYQEFTADLKVLDSNYHELKNQAALSSNRDIIIRAMLDNLRLQAGLLRRQLMIMNNFEDTKPISNEKNRSRPL